MNLLILHCSFINHHFHHSTITIKQNIIRNKIVTELHMYFEVIFCEKIVVRMENVKFRRFFRGKKTNAAVNSAVEISRLKSRGKIPNSADRLENPRSAENCGPYIYPYTPTLYVRTYVCIYVCMYICM